MHSAETGASRNPEFTATQWSLVVAAGQGTCSTAAEALEALCQRYWYPLYAFVRCKGYSLEDAQDLTQEFFARLLRNNTFAIANQEKGRFRSFLLGCLNHFLLDEWDKVRALKRGGGYQFVSLDYEELEERYSHSTMSSHSPEKIFDEQWRLVVLEKSLARLREALNQAGKAAQFDALKAFLTNEPEPGEYEAIGQSLDMKVNAITVAIHRLRQQFREAVRAEVAQTVSSAAEIEQEIRALFSF